MVFSPRWPDVSEDKEAINSEPSLFEPKTSNTYVYRYFRPEIKGPAGEAPGAAAGPKQTYLQIVFTGMVEGKDDEFNDYYDNHHGPELAGEAGFTGAQRMILVAPANRRENNSTPGSKYLAIFKIETSDIAAVKRNVMRPGKPAGATSEAADRNATRGLHVPGDRAADRGRQGYEPLARLTRNWPNRPRNAEKPAGASFQDVACRHNLWRPAWPLRLAATPAAIAGDAMPVPQQNALVQKYCAVCHDDAHRNGGLSLQHFDAAHADPGVAAMLLSKLTNGLPLATVSTAKTDQSVAAAIDVEMKKSAINAAGVPAPDSDTSRAWVLALVAEAARATDWTGSKSSPGPGVRFSGIESGKRRSRDYLG